MFATPNCSHSWSALHRQPRHCRMKHLSDETTVLSDAMLAQRTVQKVRGVGWTWIAVVHAKDDFGWYVRQWDRLHLACLQHCVLWAMTIG
eukprot:3340827-Rhodomonas_salina.3